MVFQLPKWKKTKCNDRVKFLTLLRCPMGRTTRLNSRSAYVHHFRQWFATVYDEIRCKPKQQLEKQDETFNLFVDNNTVENVSSAKLLGIYLDSNILWDVHADYTCKKIRKRMGLLLRSETFLIRQARITFYYALIQPVMDYGACVWGDT